MESVSQQSRLKTFIDKQERTNDNFKREMNSIRLNHSHSLFIFNEFIRKQQEENKELKKRLDCISSDIKNVINACYQLFSYVFNLLSKALI